MSVKETRVPKGGQMPIRTAENLVRVEEGIEKEKLALHDTTLFSKTNNDHILRIN
jgi:hypothetical protein